MSKLSEILGCIGFGLGLSATAVNAAQGVDNRKTEIKLDYLLCVWGSIDTANFVPCVAEHERKYGKDAYGRLAKPPPVSAPNASPTQAQGEQPNPSGTVESETQ